MSSFLFPTPQCCDNTGVPRPIPDGGNFHSPLLPPLQRNANEATPALSTRLMSAATANTYPSPQQYVMGGASADRGSSLPRPPPSAGFMCVARHFTSTPRGFLSFGGHGAYEREWWSTLWSLLGFRPSGYAVDKFRREAHLLGNADVGAGHGIGIPVAC